MANIGTVRIPDDMVHSARLGGQFRLSAQLEAFLRDPGPGDPSHLSFVVHSTGRFETVGCVGETYDDRLYDVLWMFGCALEDVHIKKLRSLIYSLRINGERVYLRAMTEQSWVTLMFPDELAASQAA